MSISFNDHLIFFFTLSLLRSSIESEPALVLGPLRSLEELRQEQQLQEIELRRQERERRGAEDDSTPVQEKADELTGPFHYEFSYWARSGTVAEFITWNRPLADNSALNVSWSSHR